MNQKEKKAVRDCRDLWRWLEKNPDKGKRGWSGWERIGKRAFNCPICSANFPEKTGGCNECLLYGLWEDKCGLSEESPYFKWSSSLTDGGRSKNARIIKEYCIKLLKERADEKARKGSTQDGKRDGQEVKATNR